MSLSEPKSAVEVLSGYADRVDGVLDLLLPGAEQSPESLHRAMRYAVLGGGKRLRASLVYAAGTLCGASLGELDTPAAAVELLHAYSLVHDDLPAMDDDDLRRGRPSCHVAFGEATAVLVGDALQSLAFEAAATASSAVPASNVVDRIAYFARASGSRGMVGGQALDLAAEGKLYTVDQLEAMHRQKTGGLIMASVYMGALSTPTRGERELLRRLETYAGCVGLAFQIQDDILDLESDTETLGKPQGSDTRAGKLTYPALLGLEESKQRARNLQRKALAQLRAFDGRADTLRFLSEFAVVRTS